MSVTDELRKYATNDSLHYVSDYLAIADRIDAEHERVRAESILDMTDESMAEHGWVRLPADADGEFIHIGDVMVYADGNACPKTVVALAPPFVYLADDGPRFADMCRHYHKPTVEDVLTEFGIGWEYEDNCEDRAALLAEYAAKLRLAGDAE